jgi:hypothetical protein
MEDNDPQWKELPPGVEEKAMAKASKKILPEDITSFTEKYAEHIERKYC